MTLDPSDIDAIRAETPGCDAGSRAHFLHCGASLMSRSTLAAVKAHLDLEAEIGGYAAADRVAGEIEAVYASLARLLGADATEIAVTENATAAWNQAFWSVAWTLSAGDRVLTVASDYASNAIALLQAKRRIGIEVDVVPDDSDGQLDVAALESMLDDRVKLVCVTHVPTGSGLVNPAAAVGRLTREHGVLYLLDACQSAGQLPLDVDELGCDFLTATGRKYLRGPRGTGFLYARAATTSDIEPAVLDLHGATWTARDAYEPRKDARRFENWEFPTANVLGLGVAVEEALALGLENIEGRVRSLADDLRIRLDALPQITIQDPGVVRCGIVSFTHDRLSPEEVRVALDAAGIEVGTSTVLSTRHWMEGHGLDAVVRAGVHYFNSDDEVHCLVDAAASLA